MTFRRIVVLTGAGVSAESGMGIALRQGRESGHSTPLKMSRRRKAVRNPRLVHDFYNARRRALRDAQPNTACLALAKLETAIRRAGAISCWSCRMSTIFMRRLARACCFTCMANWRARSARRWPEGHGTKISSLTPNAGSAAAAACAASGQMSCGSAKCPMAWTTSTGVCRHAISSPGSARPAKSIQVPVAR